MASRDEVLSMKRGALATTLRQGHAIDPRALDDSQYRGISLGLPAWFERLTWKTFQKTFHRDPRTGVLRGWNVRVEQRGLDAPSVARVRKAWELCGAVGSELTPQEHDEVFAAVSHLPHLLSFALVHDLSQRDNRDQLLSFAASGFRDFTRIAASSPEMWRDISLANRDA